jgi:colicin import membrane protein
LQPFTDSGIRKFPSDKKKGIFATVLIHAAILAFLILAGFSAKPAPETEEGIMVNFGTGETGQGLIEPSPPAAPEVNSSPPPSRTVAKTTKSVGKNKDEALLTQNSEEAPAVKKVDPEAQKKKLEKIEADRKAREERNAERVRQQQEDLERKRVAAEQQRQSDIMNRTKNALANSRNAGTNSTSEGITGGTGNQGVLSGSVDSKVRGEGGGSGTGSGNKGIISYDLGGRGVQSLPSPKYDYQGEGKVVVEVTVDRSGKVIQAIPGGKGSTTLDEYLLKVAKEAALAARFEVKQDAPAVQKGTITYKFVLK